MLRSNNPAASMQKVYDDCYLTCSTAIYFEKQGHEDEALRHWRSALDQIYYHNAYKIPAGYRPRSETERALQESLRDLELQCKERVDLLDALQKSKTSNGKQNSHSRRTVSGESQGGESMIAGGTIAAYDYPSLPRPQLLSQASATRPNPVTTASSQSIRDRVTPQMLEEAQREADTKRTISNNSMPSMPPPASRTSRSPSPDKKAGFFKSTLRAASGKDGRFANSLRGSKPAVPAAKAANMAWPSGHQSDSYPQSDISRQPSMDLPRMEQPSASNIGRKQNYPRGVAPSEDEFMRRAASMDLPNRSRSQEPRTLIMPGAPSGLAVDAMVRRSQDLGSRPMGSMGSMAPPPRPQPKVDIPANTSRQQTSSAPTSPPIPQLQYRSEYTNDSLDQRNLNMLKSRKQRMDMDATKAANAAQPPSPSRLRQALRMVPRKAVGSGTSPQPPSQPTYSKPAPKPAMPKEQVEPSYNSRSVVEAQQAKKVVRGKAAAAPAASAAMGPTSAPASAPAKKPAVLLADASTDDSGAETPTERSEWDSRVKYLMKHLPKGVDKQAAESIINEIVVKGDEVHWEDIAGLDIAKNALKEAVVYPFLRPDLFMGLREPARGMLLFGPPGTGKTMLARAVATESKSTFFAISASSLTSKYMGESEKLVRALFCMAKALTPAIIFVDEIDSLLSSRSGGNEHEATRRIKTEFLIQWSDLASAAAGKQATDGDASRVLVLAATNLPWAIDDAARRRFVRRQYIPLPEHPVRESQLRKLMGHQRHNLRDRDFKRLVVLTDGFSGSDITALAKDAAMGPLRALGERLLSMSPEDIRPISLQDFEASLVNIRPSVSKQGLQEFEDWAKEFGERGG